MDLEEIDINAGNWVDSAQDRNYWKTLVNAALNLRVPEAMELVRSCNQKGKIRNAFKILTCKLTGKRPLGRPRHIWEDNIIQNRK